MPYGKQADCPNPTLNDFEQKATAQEKKLWDEYLKDYPENFQRSVMAESDNFLFVCPSANLVVELEKFRHFSDSAGGVSGKKGDALREMGLKLMAFTNRELDKDFDGVCAAIDRMVKRQISQESLVEIKKREKLPIDEPDEPVKKGGGWKITVSGEYKDDEPIGRSSSEERVSTYGGNASVAVKNPVKEDSQVTTYGGNSHVVNPLTDGEEGYSYTRFNKRDNNVLGDIPLGNWNRKAEEPKAEAPVVEEKKPESAIAGAAAIAQNIVKEAQEEAIKVSQPVPETPAPAAEQEMIEVAILPNLSTVIAAPTAQTVATPVVSDTVPAEKDVFIAKSADIVGDVHIGNGSSIWYNAVLRGDSNRITIGEHSNVQDCSVLHCPPDREILIGDGVTIGHSCIVHGCTIEDDCIIGMGATVMNGAVIGKGSIVAAGALVTQNKNIPAGSLVLGSPAKVVRPLVEEEAASILHNAEEYCKLMTKEPGRAYRRDADGKIIVLD